MRDNKRPSRRVMLASSGAVVASTMLGPKRAAGEGSGPGDSAETSTGRRPTSIDPDYFRGLYANEKDPWRFATSPYERDKYAATLAALPRPHYASALDVGCSIGVFTRQLCTRCDALIGIDVVPSVLDETRARCADCRNATFKLAAVPGEWPEGKFDLIVISEVAYYLDRPDLAWSRGSSNRYCPAGTSSWFTGLASPITRSPATMPLRALSLARAASHRL